jgi:hypothetical protein
MYNSYYFTLHHLTRITGHEGRIKSASPSLLWPPSRPTTCPCHQPTIALILGERDVAMFLLLPTTPPFLSHFSDTD